MTVDNNPAKQPLISPILRWFMVAMVLANIAGMMTPLLMPLYLAELGADIGDIGLVFTLTSIAILFLQIFGGWVSDQIGRLRAVAIGSIGGIVGLVAMLLAPTWQWMIVAMSIYQIPFALVGPSFQAFIAENTAEESRGRVYGITNTIYQITGVVGPPLGGLLAGAFGFKWMLAVSALLYTTAAGLRIWMATTMKAPKSAGESGPSDLFLLQNQHGQDARDAGRRRIADLDLRDGRDLRYRFQDVRGNPAPLPRADREPHR